MIEQDRRAPPPRHGWWIVIAGLAFAVAAVLSVPLSGLVITELALSPRGSVSG
jgi:hypothetical protein